MDITAIKNSQEGLIKILQGGRLGVYDSDTLMWYPYMHGSIALPKGTGYVVVTRDNPIYFNAVETDFFGSSLSVGVNYDVYAQYINSSSFKLQLVPWSSDTERLEGSPVLQYGLFVYEGMRLIGSIRTGDSDGPIFVDSDLKRFVSNLNNRLPTYISARFWGSSAWRIQSSAWTEFPNIVRAEFICTDPSEAVHGAVGLYVSDVLDSDDQPDYDMVMALNTAGGEGIIGTSGPIVASRYYEPSSSVEGCSYGSPRLGWNWITLLVKTESASYWAEYHSADGTVGKAMLQIMN